MDLPFWLQVAGMVVAALGGTLGGFAAVRQARTAAVIAREELSRKEEDSRRDELDQVITTLSNDYRRLVEEQQRQHTAIAALSTENAELRAELARLREEHRCLAEEHVRLKAEYIQLQAEHARVATWARARGYRDGAVPGEGPASPA